MKTEAEIAKREALEKRQLLEKLQYELQELENEEHLYQDNKAKYYFQRRDINTKSREKRQRKNNKESKESNKGYLGLRAMKLYGKQPSDGYTYKDDESELSTHSKFVPMGQGQSYNKKGTTTTNSKKRNLLRK